MDSDAWGAANGHVPDSMNGPEVVCVGEVLWDSLPAGLFLGGAPLNVARHLHALGVPAGMVSRVGADRLGEEALERLARDGLGTGLIQTDSALPTGFVRVELRGHGMPEYEIVRPAAWDAIEITDAVIERTARAGMLVFGTLAQRSLVSRATVERLWDSAAVKVYDANLRPPLAAATTIRRSLHAADIVKLNRQELHQLGRWFGWPAGLKAMSCALAESFGCDVVCVTCGADGAAVLQHGVWTEHPGFAVPVRDTVGAGDAFLAAFLVGLRRSEAGFELLDRANLHGAWVASCEGAVPAYDEEAVRSIARRHARAGRVGAAIGGL